MVKPKVKPPQPKPPRRRGWSGSGGEQQVMAEPAGESLSARLARQNKAIARTMKDPANALGSAGQSWAEPKKRQLPMVHLGKGGVYSSPALYDEMSGSGIVLAKRLDGKVVKALDDQDVRPLEWHDLYRAYKHTPHQPAAVYLKYLVHRINHLDDYEDPTKGVGLDLQFLKHHKQGGAAEKNGHLVPQDFHVWMHAHPSMPEQLLAHKAKLHAELARGVGLNIRDIAGQKYVALSRGLNTDIMNHEHALSSWSDLTAPGFGKYVYHAWVPLKDLWYSYQYGPESAGGDIGHENEYLVSHTAPRYEAEPRDVKAVRAHNNPRYYDSATDDELAPIAGNDPGLLMKPGAGPKSYAAVQAAASPKMFEIYVLPTKFRTREQAIASPLGASIQNPNLTTLDLGQKVLQLSAANTLDAEVAYQALNHPAATADTARAIMSQYAPGREDILDELAQSPLSPPEVLDQLVELYRQKSPVGWLFAPSLLKNPNHTPAHADALAQLDIQTNKGPRYPEWFLHGRFSPQFINEMSDKVAVGYGQEPLHSSYIHGSIDYKSDLNKFLAAKAIFANIYNGLTHMGGNRDLGDDSVEALIEAIERHRLTDGLWMMASRQNYAPLSEGSQLRLLRALDENWQTKENPALHNFAATKGLVPSTVWALALHRDPMVRETLYHNRTVDPELLAQAWPSNLPLPEEYVKAHPVLLTETGGFGNVENDPYAHLAQAIVDRRSYAARRQAEHLIKPWPTDMAKSESDWWPVKLKEWMSSRAKGVSGYYVRVPNLDSARAIVKERVIPTKTTDEVLDGYVVMATRADDHAYHAWEQDPNGGDVLVYFETDSPPLPHEGKVYWPHEVVASEAKLAGIRPEQPLAKGEPLTRGPAFNGEKDYRPDEAGDPQFPFEGGPRKEQSAEDDGLKLPGTDLDPGEHRTALAQLGHSDRFELVLAAACFLGRRAYDAEKFHQGLAVYGDEARAALHSVDLADSDKNLRALAAVIALQDGRAHSMAKAEPQPIGIHSIQPGNEDAVDAAEAIERAVRAGMTVPLKLNGKHSKGAMAARDPKTGRVWLLKPGASKQSPAAGARDGTASQSRREVAFWHVADEVHLGGVVPRADLLIVNAQEWAAIKLLGSDWKSLDERNRQKQYKGREVLTSYLANGQIHRWAILDWVLGNTDSHGQNLLVNEGGSVALIDHGAAWAGPKFDPAHDTKSFIPFYLRVWAPEADFKKKAPEERIKHMLVLGKYEDDVLKRWLVEDFTPEMVERVARKYGIDEPVIKACLERLQELRSAPGNLSRTVNALWAGATIPKPDETR